MDKPTDARLLVRLLGLTDAIFEPVRLRRGFADLYADKASWRRYQSQAQAQADYRVRGLHVAADAAGLCGDAGGRAAWARLADSLIDRGWVRGFGGRGLRRVGLALTDKGDDYARGIVNVETLAETVPVLQALASARTWQREHVLLRRLVRRKARGWGKGSDPERLFGLQEAMLPALARGLAEANTSTIGAAAYCLTEAGRAWLKSPPAMPTESDLPPVEDWAAGEYLAGIREGAARLEAREPPRDLRIPFSASDP